MTTPVSREDFLEEDAEVPGQKFCLLSFLSPEKVLADKNLFMFERFLQIYEFQSRTKNLEAYLVKILSDINTKLDSEADALDSKDLSGAADICRKSKLRIDTTMDSFHDFVKKNERELKESNLKEVFGDFMHANKTKLEDDFYAKNEFQTTVRGVKIRGVYASQGEAIARSKKVQRQDTLHNIFIGEVGKWLPWDPEPSEVAEQEYAEEQLNTLMKKYKENEEHREAFQRERRVTGAARAKNAIASVKVTGDADATTVVEAANTQQFSSMFGSEGPADLAMERKMQKDLSGASTSS